MLARCLAATVVALSCACESPTLPLPPPEAPEQETVDATHVKLTSGCGGAEAYAQIEVEGPVDPSTNISGSVTVATSCGSWSMTVVARPNDVLTITQQYGNLFSPPITLVVQ